MAGSGAPDAGAASAEGYVAGPPEDPQRYRIDRADLESAATGGEGLVFRARDRHGRIVALKMLTAVSPDEFEQRQERARALVDVRHPNLMRHIETFLGAALSPASYPARQPDDVDLLYSVSEWIDGSPLPEATAGASTATRLGWVAELARAVAELHRTTGGDIPAGVVHRDIKPSNVRVTTAGRAILIDYGTSRAADDDLTQGVGTYLWRAPEVLGAVAAGPGTASDVWGVGAVAHWLLVGEPPQLDGAGAARHRVVQSEAARQLGDPDGVARLIGELLETVPGHRPTDLLTWARRLEQAAGRRRTRRRLVTAGRLALAAVVAIALAVWVWPRPSPERSAEVLGERQSRSSLTGSGEETPQVAVLAFGGDLSRQRRTKRTFVDPDLHIFDRRDGAYGAVVQPADHDPIQGYTPGPLLAAADGLTIYAPRSQDALPGLDLMLVDRSGGHWAVNFLAAAWTATGVPQFVATPAEIPVSLAVLSAEQIRSTAEDLLAHLHIDGGQVTIDPPLVPRYPFATESPVWALTDGDTEMLTYADRSTDVALLPGTAERVHDRPAVLRGSEMVWREDDETMVLLRALSPAGVERLPLIADETVRITLGDIRRIPLADGSAPSRPVTIYPPEGVGGVEASVRFVDADGGIIASYRLSISPDGEQLDFEHHGRASQARIFAGDDDLFRPPPRCELVVPAPPKDTPTTTSYTIDPDCHQ